MAPFIGAALATATAIGTAIGLTGALATIVGAVLVIGTVALATKALKRSKQQKQKKGITGVLLTSAGTSESIPVVYGQRRIAGHRTFIGNNGSGNNDYLHLVETLAEGPIEGIQKIFYNDELVATSSDNGQTFDYSAGSTDYSSLVGTKFFDGSQTSAISASTQLISGQDDSRPQNSTFRTTASADDNRKGLGVAYCYHVLKWDDEKFAGGLPTITYEIKGKKVPQIGSDTTTTLTYSTNPARIIHDFLIHPTYGKNIPVTLLDTDSGKTFKTAETYCAENVDTAHDDTTQTTRYECHAFLDTDESVLDNLEALLTTCRGGLITGDTYKLLLDKPETVQDITINDDNIVGNIEFLQANKKTLLNRIRAKFPDEATEFNYQENITRVDDAKFGNTTNLTADNNVVLQRDIELPHTTNKAMVDRILTEELNQSRQSGVLEVEVDAGMLALSVGDVVKFTNTTLGQTDKKYRILSTVLKPDHRIALNMREYDDNVYWNNNKILITNNKDDTDH